MVDDLLSGRVTSFRREQGFGVITLDDSRDVKFDASACTMVPREGDAVRLRIAPARWGGGFKALHVEPAPSTVFAAAPAPQAPVLDQQIAALQSEHLVGSLSEHAMAELVATAFAGSIGDASLIDVLDAFYAADPAAAQHDGYLRFDASRPAAAALAAVTARLSGVGLSSFGLAAPAEVATLDDVIAQVNAALATAGDPRRLHPLVTGYPWRACFLLAADHAQRLSAILPFA